MSTTEVVSSIAAVKPSKTAVKEKKALANKPKSGKSASHPPYFEMIKDALLSLKEKGGSSPYAISKYIEEKQKAVLPANFRKILGIQLKKSAAKGKLIKVKASYKLSESAKKETKEKKKVEKVKKAVVAAAKPAKEAASPVKKPAKAKEKQPKSSIKSPVKKAKKVAA